MAKDVKSACLGQVPFVHVCSSWCSSRPAASELERRLSRAQIQLMPPRQRHPEIPLNLVKIPVSIELPVCKEPNQAFYAKKLMLL